ncbi:MAG: SpoIIE family protein phosphatase [Deltaproteobacteria bacterium]|nr:SpoIIE family protein phosphatase [Deltaproteobacteria bacterium]
MKFNIAYEQTICRGETICGDAVAVCEDEASGITHIAVIDGLGHGPAANVAAMAFVDFFNNEVSANLPLPDLLQKATGVIARTRGVAASVMRLYAHEQIIKYAGVGNVEMSALSATPIRPISKPGIVGRRLGRIVAFEYPLHSGDVLTVFTDGISSRFKLESFRDLNPKQICREILSGWGKNHDDATVLAIRCE